MWFYDFWAARATNKTLKYRLAFAMAALVGFCGIFICGAGVSLALFPPSAACHSPRLTQTYGAVEDIKIGYAANGGTTPWSCKFRSAFQPVCLILTISHRRLRQLGFRSEVKGVFAEVIAGVFHTNTTQHERCFLYTRATEPSIVSKV